MKNRVLLITAGLLVTAALAAAYLSVRDYPRIVRSAYYRTPFYALRAAAAECWGKKRFPRSAALERLRRIGLVPTGNPRFLCLLNEPDTRIDKPIIDRYFGLLSKRCVMYTDTSFWEIPVRTGLAFVEVNTGRVIHLQFDSYRITAPEYYPAAEQLAPAVRLTPAARSQG